MEEASVLSPEQIVDVVFSTGRRGFDEAEVREFLEVVAGDYAAALDETAQASWELGELRDKYDKAVEGWRSLAASGQVAQTSLQEAQARQRQAESKAAALERERSEARSRADEAQAALELVRSERDEIKDALAKAQEALKAEHSDVYSQLGEEVAVVLRSAVLAAESARSEADLYVTQKCREADEACEQLRADAERASAQAAQRIADLRAEADEYAKNARYQADMAAMAVEAEADEKARRKLESAETDAASTMAKAQEHVTTLRATEAQVREGLEALTDWITRSLASPVGELPSPVKES